jgi:chloramphenicol 3-O phosphotransferase
MIIFLNGAGSSGKSSIAKAIQHLSDEPWLTIGIDSFINMMPWKYVAFGEKAEEGIKFLPGEVEGKAIIQVEAGEFGKKVIQIMPRVVKIIADSGLNIVIDEVLFGDGLIKAYLEELSEHKVYFIGVKCSLEVMEEREFSRGDRAIGLSRDQVNKVHQGFRPYYLEVDTTHNSSFACAKEILKYIEKN